MSKSLIDDKQADGDDVVVLTEDPTAETSASGQEPVTVAGLLAGLRTRIGGNRRTSLALAVVISLALAAGTAYLIRGQSLPDGDVAKVGDVTITVEQLEQRIDALKALYGLEEPTGGKAADTFKRDAAKSAVVSLLIETEAQERGIVVTDKQVDTILAKLIKERYPDGGQRAFVEALGTMGASEEQVRDELHQQAVVADLFDDVTADVEVSDDEVKAAFEDRKEALATPERRSLLNIVVETRAQAQAVLRLLREGESFASVARTYSIDSATKAQGGRLGVATRAELDDLYGKVAFAAPDGGLFGPVQTSTGWHVGKVADVTAPVPATFAGIEDQLKQTLETERAVAEWRSFLEELIEESDVQYHPDFRPKSPTSLPEDVEGQQP